MNNTILGLLACVSMACTSTEKLPAVDGVTHIKRSTSIQLRPFSEHTLSNGLRVLLIRDDSLPSVSYQLLVRSGASRDPVGKSGTSLMVASLLEKGTQKRTALQLADELAVIGGSFNASVEPDYTYLYANGLSAHRDRLLELFLEIVTKPSFAEVEIERIRKQILAAITQTIDNPSNLVSLAFDEFLFGSHPYGRSPLGRRKDIQSLRKATLIRHYLKYYRPNNSILAVVGHYSPDILQKLEASLKAWKPRGTPSPKALQLEPVSKLEMRVVNKSDLTQAQIRMGQEGISRQHPDFLPLRLANVILGQGFSSRLVDEVRDNLGLTYHISSEIESLLLASSLKIGTFTRNEKVGEALNKIMGILNVFVKDGVKSHEVQSAKGFLLGSFGRSIETVEKLAFNLLILRAYGISDTYLTNFEDNVESLSASDVNKAIRAHWHPDRLKVLILANQSQIMPQLRQFRDIDVKQSNEF